MRVDDEKQSKPAKSKRSVLLFFSLALNLLVVGAVAGLVLTGGPKGDPGRGAVDFGTGPLVRAMADEDRAALRETLRESRPFDRGDRIEMRQNTRALITLLREDTLDVSAVRDVIGRQQQRLRAGQDQLLDAWLGQIDAMTPEARAAYADRLAGQMRRVRTQP